MTRSVSVGLVVLLFASLAVAPAIGSADADTTRLGTPDGFTQTEFTIQVHENWNAQWTFAYSRPLENDSGDGVDEFEAFAEEFEGGLYIGEDQRLVFDAGPSSYTESGPALESSDSVTWTGDRQFTDRRPQLTFRSQSAVTEPIDPDDGTDDTPIEPATRSAGDMLLLVAVFVVVVGLVGAAVWQSGALSRRGRLLDDGPDGPAGTAAESTATDADPAGIPDEELLSDDVRVLKLLEDNGGRMKQVNIVDETEWSKSKVSMLLSEMEDEGEISKLRVGRENIISLSGQEPDAAGSPFDDE